LVCCSTYLSQPSLSAGDIVTISCGNGQTYVAHDLATLDRLIALSLVKDDEGIMELVRANQLVVVADGTHAQLVHTGLLADKVRITESEHAGESGWVSVAFVHPAPR
jgi:hypothetical protein